MGRWRRVMWCSVCMPRECVLIISSRAWWWCGAGRAGGRAVSFSRSLGDGRRGRELVCHPEVVRAELRKVDGGSEEGSPGSGALARSRRRPPSWRSAVSVAAAAGAGSLWRRASTNVFRSIPSASCLLPPAPTTRLAGGLCGERAPKSFLFDLPSPARLACWRAVTRKCARRSEMKGGSVD